MNELEYHLQRRDAEYRERIDALARAAASNAADAKDLGFVPGFIELMQAAGLAKVQAIVADVHANGYAIVPDLLSPAQVVRVRDALAPIFAECGRMFDATGPKFMQTIHMQNVLAKTRAADEVATSPLLRAAVAGVLSQDFILNAGVVAMAPDPGCEPQGLHQDDGFYRLIPRPHMPLVLTVAVALDDFCRANGGTQLVPGSQLWTAERKPTDAEAIHAEMPAGAMLLWDGALFHGGGGNTTDTTRRTLTLNYTRGWLRTQFNQYLSIPRATVLALPAELQTDLGYHRSMTGLGSCETEDPLKYLGKLMGAGGDGAQTEIGLESRIPAQAGGALTANRATSSPSAATKRTTA